MVCRTPMIKNKTTFNGLLFFALFLTVIATQKYAYANDTQYPLFKVSKDGVSFWLVGSMHTGNKEIINDEKLNSIIDAGIGVCLEYNPNDREGNSKVGKVVYYNPPNITLEKRLDSDLYKAVSKIFLQLFSSNSDFEDMSPYSVANLLENINLYNKVGLDSFTSSQSIDHYIVNRAKTSNIKILGLEKTEELSERFLAITEDEWNIYVKGYLEMFFCELCSKNYFGHIRSSYERTPDPEHSYKNLMEAMSTGPKISDIYEKLFFGVRNLNMVKRIQSEVIEKKQCSVVAVGAAHLGGENGILNLFNTSGFTFLQE